MRDDLVTRLREAADGLAAWPSHRISTTEVPALLREAADALEQAQRDRVKLAALIVAREDGCLTIW